MSWVGHDEDLVMLQKFKTNTKVTITATMGEFYGVDEESETIEKSKKLKNSKTKIIEKRDLKNWFYIHVSICKLQRLSCQIPNVTNIGIW